MRVIHEEKYPITLTLSGVSPTTLILGVYELPVLGKIYAIRSVFSDIIFIGVLPNDVSDQEAISLAQMLGKKMRQDSEWLLKNHLIIRRGKDTKLLAGDNLNEAVQETTKFVASRLEKGRKT